MDNGAGRLTKKTFHSGAYTELGYCCCVVTSIVHKKSDHTTISSESYVDRRLAGRAEACGYVKE